MRIQLAITVGLAVLWSGKEAAGSQLWGGRGVPWLINHQTGAPVSMSGYDPGFWSDAASDPARMPNEIWGVQGNSHLLTAVNPATGQVVHSVNLNTTGTQNAINGLAIDPVSGDFFGASSSALYKIDPTDGDTTLIGATSKRIDQALGFDAAGILYAVATDQELVIVDTTTAVLTSVASLGVRAEDLAARPEDGVMYALAYNSPDYQLITIDMSDGSVHLVGNSFSRPTFLAFTGVPEPSAVLIALVGFAIVSPRYRRIR
jgi:hypothetical protein